MTPKEECETILDTLLSFAKQQLKKRGEFYPFGAVMLADGSITLTAYEDQNNEFPDSVDVIQNLVKHHKEEAEQGKIRASGIAWDAMLSTADGKKTDAVLISLEHIDHYTVVVGQPYNLGLFKKLKFGEVFAQEGKHEIFN
ncbi:MAG: hypothetical protein IJV41_02855 [Oscillospiraceae bacterium]|nr:hypothetical protein [Oscillospiraceae bacterium]